MDTQPEQNTARIIENDTKPSPFSRQGIIEIIKFILLAVCRHSGADVCDATIYRQWFINVPDISRRTVLDHR